jgi:hypothetical protein
LDEPKVLENVKGLLDRFGREGREAADDKKIALADEQSKTFVP